jgi:hypothetical protein
MWNSANVLAFASAEAPARGDCWPGNHRPTFGHHRPHIGRMWPPLAERRTSGHVRCACAAFRVALCGNGCPWATKHSRAARKGDWSGRRDSNPRHPAWKAGAPPTELLPLDCTFAPFNRSRAMAVRTHDIALGDLDQDTRISGTPDHRRNIGALRARISMIKVHRARREVVTAIRTRHVSKAVEQRCLPAPIGALLFESLRTTWCLLN